jgi:hemoglobin
MDQSLYEQIGGESAVSATVLKLYDKLLDDDELAPFFENMDVDRLRLSQSTFVTAAFGGPNLYKGKTLRAAHAASVAKGLNDHHFDKVAGHLKAAMQELDVPSALIDQALAIVETTGADVLAG